MPELSTKVRTIINPDDSSSVKIVSTEVGPTLVLVSQACTREEVHAALKDHLHARTQELPTFKEAPLSPQRPLRSDLLGEIPGSDQKVSGVE